MFSYCIFCEIAVHKQPADILYEDDEYIPNMEQIKHDIKVSLPVIKEVVKKYDSKSIKKEKVKVKT